MPGDSGIFFAASLFLFRPLAHELAAPHNTDMSNAMSHKQQLLAADARYMADIIKRSRARFAALPQSEKDRIARRLEDGAAEAARAA